MLKLVWSLYIEGRKQCRSHGKYTVTEQCSGGHHLQLISVYPLKVHSDHITNLYLCVICFYLQVLSKSLS